MAMPGPVLIFLKILRLLKDLFVNLIPIHRGIAVLKPSVF